MEIGRFKFEKIILIMIISIQFPSITKILSHRIFLLLALIVLSRTLFSTVILAQAPQKFSYQAVIRGAGNQLLPNQSVNTKVSLLQGAVSGNAVYVETHSGTTNANGLLTLEIGTGTQVSGNFAAVNWANGPYYIKTETDPSGGTNYSITTTSQLLSVPYALNAGNGISRVSATGDTLYLGNGNHIIIPGISVANPGQVTDIDGNVYNTVKIGTQIWMKENLRVSKYRNGEAIPTNLNDADWQNTNDGAFSIYNNDSIYNTIYGKLYNWYAVADSRGLCPAGWHVPSDAEWKTMESFLGMLPSELDLETDRGSNQNVGGKLKSTSLWGPPNTGSTDEFGFSGLPGGYRGSIGNYINIVIYTVFWSSTASTGAYGRDLSSTTGGIGRNLNDKRGGFYVRCLKD